MSCSVAIFKIYGSRTQSMLVQTVNEMESILATLVAATNSSNSTSSSACSVVTQLLGAPPACGRRTQQLLQTGNRKVSPCSTGLGQRLLDALEELGGGALI